MSRRSKLIFVDRIFERVCRGFLARWQSMDSRVLLLSEEVICRKRKVLIGACITRWLLDDELMNNSVSNGLIDALSLCFPRRDNYIVLSLAIPLIRDRCDDWTYFKFLVLTGINWFKNWLIFTITNNPIIKIFFRIFFLFFLTKLYLNNKKLIISRREISAKDVGPSSVRHTWR